MEEGRGKYLEGMVQRAMEEDKYSGSRREFETQTKTDSGTQTVEDYTQSRARTRPDAVGSESSGGIAGKAGSTNSSGRPAREKTSARQGKGNFLKGLISGTVISDSFILKDIRYSAMILILAVVFIANRFNAERGAWITALEQEVRDLRAESLSVSADLGSVSRQSEISDLVKERGLGLEELREPPYRIVVNE
jgi:predicted RNA-binding protein YlxR (DUF448 family)